VPLLKHHVVYLGPGLEAASEALSWIKDGVGIPMGRLCFILADGLVVRTFPVPAHGALWIEGTLNHLKGMSERETNLGQIQETPLLLQVSYLSCD
jgi:hypothetical protein